MPSKKQKSRSFQTQKRRSPKIQSRPLSLTQNQRRNVARELLSKDPSNDTNNDAFNTQVIDYYAKYNRLPNSRELSKLKHQSDQISSDYFSEESEESDGSYRPIRKIKTYRQPIEMTSIKRASKLSELINMYNSHFQTMREKRQTYVAKLAILHPIVDKEKRAVLTKKISDIDKHIKKKMSNYNVITNRDMAGEISNFL